MIVERRRARLVAYSRFPKGSVEEFADDPCSEPARIVEECGRTSWRSEGLMERGSAAGFCERVLTVKRDFSISEHVHVTIKFTTDRYTTHQLVRHRLGNVTQESTHFINYGAAKRGGEIRVCAPLTLRDGTEEYDEWFKSCSESEASYLKLLSQGVKHHQARAVLPGCLAADIVLTFNLRMWRTVFEQRATPPPSNTHETVLLAYQAASLLAAVCPEVMSDWGTRAFEYFQGEGR